MYCTRCGATVNDGAEVCPACGTPVPASGTPVAANQTAPAGVAVPNYMVLSILSTVFCCLIGGIVAIVYSSQVNFKLAQGDIKGAKAASKMAKIWLIVNLALGLLLYALLTFVLAGVVIPIHMRNRRQAQAATCISNMKMIRAAGESWLMTHSAMTAPTMSDLCGPESSKYIKTEPTCPTDGSRYSISLKDDDTINVKCGSGDPKHVLPRSGYGYGY